MSVDEIAESYFSSINILAHKISEDCSAFKNSYTVKWDTLSWEEQEKLINSYIIPPSIAAKYSHQQNEEVVNCFPVYKVNCGEKIVVDFEHDDGWTWRDEHSGPFSWKTKSQQDLTLADIDEVSQPKEEKRTRVGAKPSWDAPSVLGSSDRGLNEVEKMFEKFGIKAATSSPGNENIVVVDVMRPVNGADAVLQSGVEDCVVVSPSHVYNERSILLDGDVGLDHPKAYENKNFQFEEDEMQASSQYVHYQSADNLDVGMSGRRGTKKSSSSHSSRPKKDKSKDRSHKKSVTKMTENDGEVIVGTRTGIEDEQKKPRKSRSSGGKGKDKLSLPVAKSSTESSVPIADPGQVSPVYVADHGEYGVVLTDLPRTEHSAKNYVIGGEELLQESSTDDGLLDGIIRNIGVSEISEVVVPAAVDNNTATAGIKTGFEFLDDW